MIHTNKKIKVLVVDDSAFMRKILSDILNSDESIEVIGKAKNGREAIDLSKSLKPEVITLDIEMPILNGIDALKEIMRDNPLPVVMLSSLTSEGAESTLISLELGAVDFIQKPSSLFDIKIDSFKNEFINKVKAASQVQLLNTKTNKSILKSPFFQQEFDFKPRNKANKNDRPIVLIGTSTGGPRALQSVIPLLPKNTEASYLIVQHMPAGFTKSLADRLNQISKICVKEAKNGEKVLPNYVYIAPGDFHLKLKKNNRGELETLLTQEEAIAGHRPSVDMLFQSITQEIGGNIIAVIMTGMGSDGTQGIKFLKKNSNTYVIAQDEETSIVFGMPRSAIKTGLVDEVVGLENIAKSILNRLGV